MSAFSRDELKKRDLFLDRLAHILNTDRQFAEQCVTLDRKQALRVNPLVGSAEETLSVISQSGWELEQISWSTNSFVIQSAKQDVSHSDLFNRGAILIQNASSFLPPMVLNPQSEESILDMCAAPGGKTAHIAALTHNRAHIWVNEISIDRVRGMKSFFSTTGVRIEMLLNQPAQYLDETLMRSFDRVLLDAPCSSEGLIDLRKPNAMQYWSGSTIKRNADLQHDLILAAAHLVKPGGTLVYSTCTFAPEENEAIIDHLLSESSDLAVQDITLDIPNRMPGLSEWQGVQYKPEVSRSLRILPTPSMEGFFVCVLKKQLE